MILTMYWNKNLDFARDHFLSRKKHKDWSVGENTYSIILYEAKNCFECELNGQNLPLAPISTLFRNTQRERERQRGIGR